MSGAETPLTWIQAGRGEQLEVYVAESGPYELEIRTTPGDGYRLRIWQVRRENAPLLRWESEGYDLAFAQARAGHLLRRIQRASEAWEWHIQETYKGLITLSVEVLKALTLVNGGAAVALLTYAGNHVAHNPNGRVPSLEPPLLWYCSGLSSTVVAFILAYWTQLRLYQEERQRHEGQPFRQRHGVGIWIAGFAILGATFAFAMGCLCAASALRKAGAL